MFEKVSRSVKYDSNIFFVHKRIYIYMDTTTDYFTPLALRVRGKKYGNKGWAINYMQSESYVKMPVNA